MALAGYWNQIPVPLESPPVIQIHAAFRDAHSSGKLFSLIVSHPRELPGNPPVFLSSRCTILGGSVASVNTLNPQSLLPLMCKRRALAMVMRCAARECMYFPRPLERCREGGGCAVDVSSRRSHSSCTERTPVLTTVGTWRLNYTQRASSSSRRAI